MDSDNDPHQIDSIPSQISVKFEVPKPIETKTIDAGAYGQLDLTIVKAPPTDERPAPNLHFDGPDFTRAYRTTGHRVHVPPDPVAILMYYLSCISQCIGINCESENIDINRLTNYIEYLSLNSSEVRTLYNICKSLSPVELEGKSLFITNQNDKRLNNLSNNFVKYMELEKGAFAGTLELENANFFVIGNYKVIKLNEEAMLYTDKWACENYYSAISQLDRRFKYPCLTGFCCKPIACCNPHQKSEHEDTETSENEWKSHIDCCVKYACILGICIPWTGPCAQCCARMSISRVNKYDYDSARCHSRWALALSIIQIIFAPIWLLFIFLLLFLYCCGIFKRSLINNK